MFYLRYLLLIFAVVLLESTVAQRLALGPVRPDFALALVVFAGLFGGGRGGVIVGFVVGLLRGCAEPHWLGLEALLLCLVGFAAGSTSPMVNREHPVMQAMLIGLLLLAHDLVRVLVAGTDGLWRSLLVWLSVSPAAAIYTALLVPLAVLIFPRLLGRGKTRALS